MYYIRLFRITPLKRELAFEIRRKEYFTNNEIANYSSVMLKSVRDDSKQMLTLDTGYEKSQE